MVLAIETATKGVRLRRVALVNVGAYIPVYGLRKLAPATRRVVPGAWAGYDLIGFSVMTIDSEWAKKIIAEVRKRSPETYIVIGGMHAIVCPEDCLDHADAVCTGEGDLAFDEMLERMRDGVDWHDVRNF